MAKKEAQDITLSKKQRKFFERIALGDTLVQAAKTAGYKSPRSSASETVQNHTAAFREAFVSAGYTIPDIVRDIIEGTKAMRTISAVNTDKEANGATCDFIEVADWNARHKFIDSAIKLQGFYPNEKLEIAGKGGGPLNITVKYE